MRIENHRCPFFSPFAIVSLSSVIEQQCRLLYFLRSVFLSARARTRVAFNPSQGSFPIQGITVSNMGLVVGGWWGAVEWAKDGESRGGFQFYDPKPLLIPFFFRLLYSSFYSPPLTTFLGSQSARYKTNVDKSYASLLVFFSAIAQ